jgi:hypothetical protein
MVLVALVVTATQTAGQPADRPSGDNARRYAQAEDLATFRRDLLDVDASYSKAARAEAERRLAVLEKNVGSTGVPEFNLELCRIAALADNGHTGCFLPTADIAPLVFMTFDGEFAVVVANTANSDLLAARLIAIDGHPVDVIRAAGRQLHGGVLTLRDTVAASILNKPDLLHAMGFANEATSAMYSLRTPDGRQIERRLSSEARDQNWPGLPAPDHVPWSLQERDQPFRRRDAPEMDAVVIQLRQNFDSKNQTIGDFLAESESHRARLGRRNVVLDMRSNPGGNFLLTRQFLIDWPMRLPSAGKFFVLIGPRTFSAGIADVAYLKQAGGDRVILIGEPMGDRLMFFSEGRNVKLPHSGLSLSMATQREEWQEGCRNYGDCFVSVAQPGAHTGTPPEKEAILDKAYGRIPLAVPTLDPEVKAPWTVQDYLEGRDPGMDATLMLISGSHDGKRP